MASQLSQDTRLAAPVRNLFSLAILIVNKFNNFSLPAIQDKRRTRNQQQKRTDSTTTLLGLLALKLESKSRTRLWGQDRSCWTGIYVHRGRGTLCRHSCHNHGTLRKA